MTTEQKLAQDLVAADQHLQHSDFDKAYKIYHQLLKQFQSPEIYNNAAICAYNLELLPECLSLINQAIRIQPNNPWYITQHAQFVAATDFNLADQLFNNALTLANQPCELPKDEQDITNEQVEYQQKLAILSQIELCYANFLFNYGCLHARNPEKSEINHAINLFKKSLEFDKNHYKSAYNLACCYINLDNLNEGLEYLFKTIKLNPTHSQAHFALSQYYQQQNNLTLAEEYLQKSLSSRSFNQANAEYNYGVLEQKRNNYDQALQHYQNCLEIDPSHFAACYNSASIYHRLENYQDAVKFYNLASTIKPEDKACQYLLASLSDQSSDLPSGQSADSLTGQNSASLSTQSSASLSTIQQQSITQAPQSYVENLFDSYAENFDHELVVNLDYKTPELLHDLFIEHISNKNKELTNLDILDLGCGTGLSGKIFKPLAQILTGVDISGKMLDAAANKKIYDKLIKSDLDSFLIKNIQESTCVNSPDHTLYDLIILADVLVYYGDLKPLFANIEQNLKPGGWLLFSTEVIQHHQKINLEYELQITSRFAHKIDYVASVINHTKLQLEGYKVVSLRKHNHQHINGALYLASKKSRKT